MHYVRRFHGITQHVDQMLDLINGFEVSGHGPSQACLTAVQRVTCHAFMRKCRPDGTRLNACQDACNAVYAVCDDTVPAEERLLYYAREHLECGSETDTGTWQCVTLGQMGGSAIRDDDDDDDNSDDGQRNLPPGVESSIVLAVIVGGVGTLAVAAMVVVVIQKKRHAAASMPAAPAAVASPRRVRRLVAVTLGLCAVALGHVLVVVARRAASRLAAGAAVAVVVAAAVLPVAILCDPVTSSLPAPPPPPPPYHHAAPRTTATFGLLRRIKGIQNYPVIHVVPFLSLVQT